MPPLREWLLSCSMSTTICCIVSLGHLTYIRRVVLVLYISLVAYRRAFILHNLKFPIFCSIVSSHRTSWLWWDFFRAVPPEPLTVLWLVADTESSRTD
jgi:hypothetical protein